MYTHDFIVGVVLSPEQLKGITAYITKEVLQLTDSITCMEGGAFWSRPLDPESSWSVKLSTSPAAAGCTIITLALSDEFEKSDLFQKFKNHVSRFEPSSILKPNFTIKIGCLLNEHEQAAFFSAFLKNYSLFVAFSTSRFINSRSISSEGRDTAVITFNEKEVQIQVYAGMFDSKGYPPNQIDLKSLLQTVAPRAFGQKDVPSIQEQSELDLHSFVYTTPRDQPCTIFPEHIGAFLLDSKKLFGDVAIKEGKIERTVHPLRHVADYLLVLPNKTQLMGVRYFGPKKPIIVTIDAGMVVEGAVVKAAEAANGAVPGKKTLLQNKLTENLNSLLDISVESLSVTVKPKRLVDRLDDAIDRVGSLVSRLRRRQPPSARIPEPKKKAVSG